MRVNSVSPALAVICACLVIVPGAIVGTPGVVEDELFPEQAPEITVEPASGAEQFVTDTSQTANGNTNVSIEIANPGVNVDAITEFQELLVITHTDNTNAGSVNIIVEQQDRKLTVGRDLTPLEADSGVGAAGSNLTLSPGESETLGIEIDTTDVDVGETLTTTITIKTQVGPIPRPSDPIPPTLISATEPPKAEATVDGEDEVRVNQPVNFTATGSRVTSLSSFVEGQAGTPVENQAVIDGPFNLSEEDPTVTSSGAIQFTPDRQAVQTPSEDIRIVHSPAGNDEWTLLETDVTEQGQELILEATPEAELGTVAIVDDSNVEFVWGGDLPESVGSTSSSGGSVNTLASQNVAGGDRIQTQTGGAMPTASVFLSIENSKIVDRLKTTAGITATETETETEQVQGEATPTGPTGFTVPNANFDEVGSKNITVTLIDADGRESTANTTIDVIEEEEEEGEGIDSDNDDDDPEPGSDDESESSTDGQEQSEGAATAPEEQQPEQGSDIEVEVETETGTEIDLDVEPIPVDALPEGESRPTAVIDSSTEEETEDSNVVLTTTGEAVTLDGTRSTVGSTETVSTSQQVLAAVDIDPGPTQEDSQATVTLTANRSTLGQSDPDGAVIGRLTDEGWQPLDTDVAAQGDSAVLEAQTPGFSPFAIFADSAVQYTWTLPDGSTATGRDIQTEFNDPGTYEAELTVTNSLGQSDTTTQTIIVNDLPAIENINTTRTQTDEGKTRLTANISNEIGNTSVQWEFPDGTIKTGQTVTYPTEETQYTVQVRVEDEYGEEASAVETVVIPPENTLGEQSTVPQQALIPGILSVIGILGSVAGYRVVPWATILTRIRRNPRIVKLGAIFYDNEDRCVGVESLVVEDDNRPIIAIRLSIVNSDGDELLTKEITPDATGTTEIGTYRYELTPAELYVPPTLSIDETEPYTIAVKTVNEKEKTATEHTAEFRFDA